MGTLRSIGIINLSFAVYFIVYAQGFLSYSTRGQFWPSGIVVAASVCLSVYGCVSVNHKFVHVITYHPFKLGPPNLDQVRKHLG